MCFSAFYKLTLLFPGDVHQNSAPGDHTRLAGPRFSDTLQELGVDQLAETSHKAAKGMTSTFGFLSAFRGR
jgi:hypothetical protein